MPAEIPENLSYISEQVKQLREADRSHTFDGGGGGGYDHPMEERVKKLEQLAEQARTDLRTIDTRLTKIETRMDAFATREDLHKEMSAQTWKLVTFVCSFGTALVGITYFLATHAGK